ncbi:IPT/TIG domain-containing protein [Sphingobacterium yanglingense]|uniref:IPT/TIG domain-containing protein n=1 Tax=Sphingobacterium yanglingense TaxID=1437280 RepID=A0A4R6W4R5_9SPHI|nr:IPT/TIG domain-containing protein [Sphingobacterium yanglingense]TDQ73698.1 IPT/TIG domain-containing protein [Sphingobacterium yanglingense]
MKRTKLLYDTTTYRTYCHLLLLLVSVGLFIIGCKKEEGGSAGPKNPIVESFYPNSGNEGTLVTLLGKNLNAEKVEVHFAGTKAEIFTSKEDELVVQAPKGGNSGMLVLAVGDKRIEVGNYTYQALSIHGLSPSNGTAGSHIRISGTGFSSIKEPAKVQVNGKEAIVISVSDTVMVAQVPKDAGTGAVVVRVNGMESTGPIFTYQTIEDIKPRTGGVGTRITVKGTGFNGELSQISADINGSAATLVSANDTEVVLTVPQGTESGPLSITINGQRITGPDFTMVPPPSIDVVSPLSAPAGTEIAIKGLNFSTVLDENKVLINGQEVTPSSVSFSEIKFILPSGIGAGDLVVNVNGQSMLGPKFTEQNLGIQSVSPDNGLAGTEVIIKGIGFSADMNQNQVYFNGVQAQILSANSSEIKVIAPANLSTGQLQVHSNGLIANAPNLFRRAGIVTIAGGPNTNIFDFQLRNGSLAVDSKGNIYVAECVNNVIKKVTPSGQVSLFAGSSTGKAGYANSTRDKSLFNMGYSETRLWIDHQDNLYIAEKNNSAIRIIRANSENVETYIEGTGTENVLLVENGDFYALRDNGQLYHIPKATGNRVEMKLISSNNYNTYIGDRRFAIGPNNFLYRLIDDYDTFFNLPTGIVGSYSDYGYKDGIGDNARLGFKIGSIIKSGPQELVVLDGFVNGAIRKVNTATREVSTILKFVDNTFKDGTLHNAGGSTNQADMYVTRDGTIYLLDTRNQAVRKIFLK